LGEVLESLRPGDKPLDLEYISEKIRLAYEEKNNSPRS
jgi:hypothetical protein